MMTMILPFSISPNKKHVFNLSLREELFESSSCSSSYEIAGLEVAALWSNRSKRAYDYFSKLVEAHKQGNRELVIRMSNHFDDQVMRYHDDKRSGSDKALEPLSSGVQSNKVLKDGITRFNEILADKSAEFFYYIVSGTGTTAVSVGQRSLAAENARVDMRLDGLLDAYGNILLMRARFPTGIANARITEFGAADKPSDPSTFAWRVVLDPTEYFDHIQGETWYTSSHYLVTYSK